MKFCLLTLLILVALGKSSGQHHIVDSLKRQLSLHQQEDTLRVKLFLQLSSDETYDHPTVAGNYAMEAKTLAEKLNYQEGLALAYRLMGLAFWSQANHSAALANFLRGLKIADSIHNAQAQADLTGNLGMVYNDLGDYPKALTYYRASLNKQRELSNILRQAVMHINIGNGYYHLNQFDSALAYYQTGLKMMSPFKKSAKPLIDLGTIGVGDAYAGLGNFDDALTYYYKAKGSSDTTRHNRGRAHSRMSLANLFIKKHQYQQAEKELTACLAIARVVNLKTYVRDSYELLAKVTELQNNPVQAYRYFKLYSLYKDSIRNSAEDSKISSLQLEYELQRKQLEINSLKKDAALNAEELKLKNTILLSVIFGILLVTLSLFVAVRSFKNQKSLNALLQERNVEITNQQTALARQRDEVLALNEEIRSQQDEVISQRDILAEKNSNIEILHRQVTENNQNLEKTVAERTAALKEQNRQLEEYAFINAHKLRAPVASVMGLINLLEKDLPASEQKPMIEYLKKSAAELDKVIHSISDMLQDGLNVFDRQEEKNKDQRPKAS